MFSRTDPENMGAPIPENVTEKINLVINEYFLSQCENLNKVFQTHGFIVNKEVLIIFSLVDHRETASPISLFLSLDVEQQELDQSKLMRLLFNFADLGQMFFDTILKIDNWSDYVLSWQPHQYKKNNFYYKITRENPELSLLGNQLLSDFSS